MPDPITITQDTTPPVQEEVVANLEAEAAELHAHMHACTTP